MYVYVILYMYMHVCANVFIYAYICTYVCIYVCVIMYVCRVVVSIHMQFRDAYVYKHELSMSRTAMNLVLLSENCARAAVLMANSPYS